MVLFCIAITGTGDECRAVSEPAEEEKQPTKGRNFAGNFSNFRSVSFIIIIIYLVSM